MIYVQNLSVVLSQFMTFRSGELKDQHQKGVKNPVRVNWHNN